MEPEHVEVVLPSELTVSKVRDRVVLFDEIDFMIQKSLIMFKQAFGQTQLSSIICCKVAKKRYCLSATLDSFEE